jgi:hypothetical protein
MFAILCREHFKKITIIEKNIYDNGKQATVGYSIGGWAMKVLESDYFADNAVKEFLNSINPHKEVVEI